MKTLILNDAFEVAVSAEGVVTLGKHQASTKEEMALDSKAEVVGKLEPVGEMEPVEVSPAEVVDEDYGAIVDEAEIQGEMVVLRWGTYQKRITLAEYKELNVDD
jgi:hypothetical protein